jgi:hypothetical protein
VTLDGINVDTITQNMERGGANEHFHTLTSWNIVTTHGRSFKLLCGNGSVVVPYFGLKWLEVGLI